MAKIYDDLKIKVFLTSTDADGQPIDYDLNKIKVTVTELYDSHQNRFPLVRLKRLSINKIAKFTQSADRSATINNPKNDNTKITDNQAVPQHSYATRARRQYFSDESKNSTKNGPKLQSKRKSDLESAKRTISKKQKVTKENGLPPTIEIANHTNVICKQKTKTSTEMNGNYIVATLDFSINEIVWGKIRGWSHWPVRITSIEGRRL